MSSALSRHTRLYSTFNLGKLSHVAIATPNIEKSMEFYKNILKAKVTPKEAQPEHGVYSSFVELGNTKIEFITPYSDKSPIQGFLDKYKKPMIHHICIQVDDIHATIDHLKKNNIRTLGQVKIGAHGLPVIFLHPKDADGKSHFIHSLKDVLVELEELKKDPTH